MKRVLIVDDELGIRELLREILADEGYRCVAAGDARGARTALARQPHDLALVDLWLPDDDGLTLLREFREQLAPGMPVIIMSGHGTLETAMDATRAGAADFLEKPITLQRLLSAVERALQPGRAPAREPAPAPATAPASTVAPRDAHTADWFDALLELPIREARDEFERRYMLHHLAAEQGSVARLAKKTGIERTHLYRKLRALGIGSASAGGTANRSTTPPGTAATGD